jgi:hypothetical protein
LLVLRHYLADARYVSRSGLSRWRSIRPLMLLICDICPTVLRSKRAGGDAYCKAIAAHYKSCLLYESSGIKSVMGVWCAHTMMEN